MILSHIHTAEIAVNESRCFPIIFVKFFLTLHPKWTDEDFNNILIPDLQHRGYGWLRPEGVRAKLEEMQKIKNSSFWKRIFS